MAAEPAGIESPVMVDTNVLVTATAPERTHHSQALELLNEWPIQGIQLATTDQILREYLVVATRPLEGDGLGLDPDQALANVAAFRARMTLLTTSETTVDVLLQLVRATASRGKVVHDAGIVALMLSHGIETIVTANVRDFARFAERVRAIDLADV